MLVISLTIIIYSINTNLVLGKKKKIQRHINTSFRRLYQCQSKIFSTFLSKTTKYNRVPLGFDPSVARLLGHDPTPRPTCPVVLGKVTPQAILLLL